MRKTVVENIMVFLTNLSYIVVVWFSIADFVITIYVHAKRKDIIEQKGRLLKG